MDHHMDLCYSFCILHGQTEIIMFLLIVIFGLSMVYFTRNRAYWKQPYRTLGSIVYWSGWIIGTCGLILFILGLFALMAAE